MPRKRRPIQTKSNKTHLARRVLLWVIIGSVIIAGATLVKIIIEPSHWQTGDRFIVISENSDKSALIKIYESQSQTLYELRIPADTQIESAHNLGKWRLGSLWQLYGDEGLEKSLVADSISLSMGLPIDSWRGDLKTKDRLKITLFELKAAKSKNIIIDPIDSDLIYEVKLVDGDMGFVAKEKIPGSIARLFASENVLHERTRLGLRNHSEENGKIGNISKIIEVLGTKIATVERDSESDMDCVIKYRFQGEFTARKLGNIFSCQLKESDEIGSLDILIEVGDKFWKRF